jgi:S-adenosylmethionine synthetase
MGRKCEVVTKTFVAADGSSVNREVKLFPWEELDCVDALRAEFGC